MWIEYSVSVVVVVVLIVLVRRSCVYVRAGEAVVVERRGKLDRTLTGGWHLLVPLLDWRRPLYWRSLEIGLDGTPRMVDRLRRRVELRETRYELTDLAVTTSDDIPFKVALSYSVAIEEPLRAVAAHTNLPQALADITAQAVQQQVARLSAEALYLKDLSPVASTIREVLPQKLAEFGLKLCDLQVSSATCSDEIRTAVEQKIAATTKKEAAVVEAETAAETTLAQARTQQQVDALVAESQRRSIELTAAAEAEAIRAISAAMGTPEMARQAIATRYLDILRQMAANTNAKFVFVPFDSSLAHNQLDWIRQFMDLKPGSTDDA